MTFTHGIDVFLSEIRVSDLHFQQLHLFSSLNNTVKSKGFAPPRHMKGGKGKRRVQNIKGKKMTREILWKKKMFRHNTLNHKTSF